MNQTPTNGAAISSSSRAVTEVWMRVIERDSANRSGKVTPRLRSLALREHEPSLEHLPLESTE